MSKRYVCKHCGQTVELKPQYASPTDAAHRWIHMPQQEYRCHLFAYPYSPFGAPIEVPEAAT